MFRKNATPGALVFSVAAVAVAVVLVLTDRTTAAPTAWRGGSP